VDKVTETQRIEKARAGYKEGCISILINSAVFIIKIFFGFAINSISLITDAFHTLSDVSTSGIVLWASHTSKKPPDNRHPFGHGRIEYIASLVISVLLVVAGFTFLQQGIRRLLMSDFLVIGKNAYVIGGVILITALMKEGLARYSMQLGKKWDNKMLVADAWHHRSDALASLAVAIGIFTMQFGYGWIDPVLGMIIAVVIMYTGYDIGKHAGDRLMGIKFPEDENKLKEIVQKIDGVRDVHEIQFHDYGIEKVVSFHVMVEKDMTVDEAHKMADIVEEKVRKFTYIPIVHIEPESEKRKTSKKGKKSEEIEKFIEILLKKNKNIISFYDLHILAFSDWYEIKMHVVVDKNIPIEKAYEIGEGIKKDIKKRFSKYTISIHFDPCGGNCLECTIKCPLKDK
jgi:cation diffusion facilitator family transporter